MDALRGIRGGPEILGRLVEDSPLQIYNVRGRASNGESYLPEMINRFRAAGSAELGRGLHAGPKEKIKPLKLKEGAS